MNCPNCQCEIAKGTSRCDYCGHRLVADADAGTTRGRRVSRRAILISAIAAVAILLGGFVAWQPDEVHTRLVRLGLAKAVEPPAVLADDQKSGGVGGSVAAPANEDEPASIPGAGQPTLLSLVREVQPPGGYPLPASYGDLGPRLLEEGAIDYNLLALLYLQNGHGLTDLQVDILKKGSDSQVVIDAEDSYFLLNFFWAVGLVNKNPILDDGPMQKYGDQGIGGFASTGGWSLGTKPATELYSSAELIPLTAEQQARVQQVADAVYRPCCSNPTSFPDCNHGMAMLGLLELMASQGASVGEMFQAVKYVNAFWFPQQTLEVALYFEANEGTRFADLDASRAFGAGYFSGGAFGQLHKWLAENNLLEQAPGQGGSCGV